MNRWRRRTNIAVLMLVLALAAGACRTVEPSAPEVEVAERDTAAPTATETQASEATAVDVDSLVLVVGKQDSNIATIHPLDGRELREVTFDGAVRSFGLPAHNQSVVVAVTVGDENQLHLLDTDTDETTQFYSGEVFPAPIQPALGSPWLATFNPKSGGWSIVNLDTGEMQTPSDLHPLRPPSFASDVPLMAYSTLDGPTNVIDLRDGTMTLSLPARGAVTVMSASGKSVAQGELFGPWSIASLDTGEVTDHDDVELVISWIDDETAVVMVSGDLGVLDIASGDVVLMDSEPSTQLPDGPIVLDRDSGENGLVQVTDLASGTVTTTTVVENSPIAGARYMHDRFVWGFLGGRNGSDEALGGWVLDRESGVVTPFEQSLPDGGSFAASESTFNADRSAVIFSDNVGGLYLARSGEELERLPVEGATRATFCPDGSIVVFTPDSDQNARLLRADYAVIASFEPADWALCAEQPG